MYSDICAHSAYDLAQAAERYNEAREDFETECDEFGLNRYDNLTCGMDGDVRADLREAKEDLRTALDTVEADCGILDRYAKMLRKMSDDIKSLKKQLAGTQAQTGQK